MYRAAQSRKQTAAVKPFPGPSGGWVQNVNLMAPARDQAERLDNIFPIPRGGKFRAGVGAVVQVGPAITRVMPYTADGAEIIVAATKTTLTIVDNLSVTDTQHIIPFADGTYFDDDAGWDDFGGTVETADVTGLSSGDWSFTQFANSSGEYLYMVNQFDGAYTFDGGALASRSLTGATGLSDVWNHGKRLFFVEEGTLSAWYLATNAITGALTEFPLQGVFSKGGSLLFGASWSIGAGDGLGNKCAFFSTEGEVAVYAGTDPATDFVLEGVYEMGAPLNKMAWFQTGGDIAVLTEEGIVSLASSLRMDPAAVIANAITYPIEDAWREAVRKRANSYPFNVVFWRRESQLIIAGIRDAGEPVCFVSNAQTGAWCRYTGWDMQSACVVGGEMYFGTSDGYIYKANTGGTDAGRAIKGVYLSRFDSMGSPSTKAASILRIKAKTNTDINVRLFCNADYIQNIPTNPPTTTATTPSAWGASVWGSFTWGGQAVSTPIQEWQDVDGIGSSLAVGLVCDSLSVDSWEFEIAGFDLAYQSGSLI